jgi:curved DNA-binding protein CbpA
MNSEIYDYYKILEIDPSASLQEIKRSFRKKAKEFHPDIRQSSSVSDKEMRLLIRAYSILSNPEKRQEYDRLTKNLRQRPHFDYRDFLKERTEDYYSQSQLVFHDLLHNHEEEALLLFERLIYEDKIDLEEYLGREDYMDCAFLLAEEYDKKKEYLQAYKLLVKIAHREMEKPYFRHFMDEVIERLRIITCVKMTGVITPEDNLRYLLELLELKLFNKERAYFYKKIAEIHISLGNREKARYYLSLSMKLKPGISGIKKLRKKAAC